MISETDLYKNEYLKYKKDYLILKNQNSGSRIFEKYYTMYVILDEKAYEATIRKIIHFDLSLQNIELELTGSALKITENSNNIKFVFPTGKDDLLYRHVKRNTGILLKVRLPEFKYKNNIRKPNNVLGKMNSPYKFGNIYKTKEFITKISEIIVNGLQRKKKVDEDNITAFNTYEDVNVENPFYGVMIFCWTNLSCNFIEAYKLKPSTEVPAETVKNDGYIKINTIAKLGENMFTLVEDDTIIDPNLSFIDII